MATVIPKIGTSGNVIEYVSVLDPSDFFYFATDSFGAYNVVLQHAHVGRLDQVETQLHEDRGHMLIPLEESIWHSLRMKDPAWWSTLDEPAQKKHVATIMDLSEWHEWELAVSTKSTYELVCGIPWAELPKLMGTDLWRPSFLNVKINWRDLWTKKA